MMEDLTKGSSILERGPASKDQGESEESSLPIDKGPMLTPEGVGVCQTYGERRACQGEGRAYVQAQRWYS